MKVAVVAPYTSLEGEPKSNRYKTLAKMFADADVEVTLVTSRFNHASKKMRKEIGLHPYPVKLIWEVGYESNTSLLRVFSHFCFLLALSWWLLWNARSFDRFVCAVPFSFSVLLCRLFGRGKVIADVQDIWPESFSTLSLPPLALKVIDSTAIFSKAALAVADEVVTVSSEFTRRCERLCPGKSIRTIYIGSEVSQSFDRLGPQEIEGQETIRIGYIGTVGHSYDLAMVGDAISGFKGRHAFELFIVGGGPQLVDLKSRYAGNLSVRFIDYLPFDEMLSFLDSCHFAVNPIIPSSSATVTNKVSDYFSIGIPFISGQNSAEVESLVSKVSPKLCYRAGSKEDFCNVLFWIDGMNNSEYSSLGRSTKEIGRKLFIRSAIYAKFVALVCAA